MYLSNTLYFPNRRTAEYKQCKVIILPKTYTTNRVAIGFQKDSPFSGLIDYYIKQMKQDGALDKFIQDYKVLPQTCPDNTGKALGFNNLMFPFLVMASGCLISLIIALIEHLMKVLKKDTNDGIIEVPSDTNMVDDTNETQPPIAVGNSDIDQTEEIVAIEILEDD